MKLQIPVDHELKRRIEIAAAKEARSVAKWCQIAVRNALPADLRKSLTVDGKPMPDQDS